MKKTFIIVGIMILAFSLIACGNAGVVNEPEEVVAETETENVAENTTEEATEPVEENTSTEEELAVGKLIPNYELNTLEGDTVSLHDYQGNILILNFWATW